MRMRASLAFSGLGLALAVGLFLLVGNGCAGDGPQELPPEPPPPAPVVPPAEVVVPTAPQSEPAAPASSRPSLPPLSASAFTPLTLRGTRGGSLAYDIEGRPADVAAMLLDFEGANGVRPWAQSYSTLSQEGNTTRSRWQFSGKMGVNPTVVLELVRQDLPDGSVRIRYKLGQKAFGLAAFFGDWRVQPHPDVADRSQLTARIYIDSGLPFVNASSQDIEDGLREDAAKMRAWMERRLASGEGSR